MAGILTTVTVRALQLYHDLLNFFFPPACLVCNGYPDLFPICTECNDRLITLPAPVCCACRTFRSSSTDCCPDHDAMTVWALGLFDSYYRRLLHHFKFNGRIDTGDFLGQRLAPSLARSVPPADLLVPVPLHPARQRERGYNQSELLARSLGRALDIPVARNLIRRVRNTPSQTDLGREERQYNVQQAFTASAGQWTGSRVLLVDDVLTTGSTLESCRCTLRDAGFVVLGAAVVALAEPPTASYEKRAAGTGAVRKFWSGR